ncbi:phospholipid phosphatase [Ureibacillus aquaedulcis]|uniref:Phospholipid phosphatase n=1 Tax=Ureibacillus aquaedulcis TaxID=3058421 RepID=A0ABT8GSJ3_9BACL|nr:phospholipid phosphatase [Ureibacillus sp. BA0131]MDN4494377.1 phospholipid phosphatase [Ureibacillus sp. BA0131]
MNTFIYFLLAFGYVVLLVWGLILSKKNMWNLTNVLLLVIIGLIYDNFIIAAGRFIGEGQLLEGLNYARFWLHALFTPTLVLFAFGICSKLGLPWAKKTFWKVIFGLITLALILYELFTSAIGLNLRTRKENGLLSYESVESAGPIMVILVTVVLVIVGIILLKNFHFPWLLIGTLVMIGGSILGIWIKNFPLTNILEFLLILSLLLTKQFQVRLSEISTTD